MDRRQQKTRKAVFAAFEELISKKRYEQITVQEIIDLADIGRTTFYAHFETKDSVLDSLCSDLFNHIFEEHPAEENTHDFSKSDYSENNMLTHILYHLREDKSRYGRLFTGESGGLFWSRFKLRFQEKLREQISSGKWEPQNRLPEDLYMELFTGSFVDIVTWWFRHSCKESPEQIETWFEMYCGIRKASGNHLKALAGRTTGG